MTNIFRDVRRLVLAAIDDLAAQGALPPGLDLGAGRGRAAARSGAWRSLHQRGDGAGRCGQGKPDGAGRADRRRADARASWSPAITAAAASPSRRRGRVSQHPAWRPEIWHAQLRAILRAGTGFGDSAIGAGERVNVEFVSANPTGPMHVGHGRGAVVGDALAALLAKAGFAVEREYYINDAGAQVDILARSLHLRYREALGEANGGPIPEGFYPGRLSDRDRPGAGRARRARNGSIGRKRVARPGARLRRRRR